MLYGCDGRWWKERRGVPDFQGLKLTQDADTAKRFADVHLVDLVKRVDHILMERPGVIGDGGNSGFQALNLAIQFGARKIILAGFDMRIDRGVHWHGRHQQGNNPSDNNLANWRRVFNMEAPRLQELGVAVFNASLISALTAFPILSFEEALKCCLS